MGSPAFSAGVLELLVAQHGAPVLVVTQAPKGYGRGRKLTETAVASLSRRLHLPLLETGDVNQPSVVSRLHENLPEVLVVVAFGQLLKDAVLTVPKILPVNLHTSWLPEYRGAAPIQWAIWNGESETGITVQKITRKLDAGDIILQKKIPVGSDETAGALLDRIIPAAADILIQTLQQMENNMHTLSPQDESLATHAPKLTKEQAMIDWTQSAGNIRNMIRALQPWPVAETLLGGYRLRIFRAGVHPGAGEPGQVFTDSTTFLEVQCGKDRLALEEIQLADRKRLEINQFLSAYRGKFPFRKMGGKD
jgi:methionyl-tRNA formyltransferase